MKSLLILSLSSVVGATRAWAFSIKVRMNFWKRLLFGGATGVGAKAGVGKGPRAGLKVGYLIADFI